MTVNVTAFDYVILMIPMTYIFKITIIYYFTLSVSKSHVIWVKYLYTKEIKRLLRE